MEGCNHWVQGGQPRGLIPRWRLRWTANPCTRRSGHVTIFARAVSGFLSIRSGKPSVRLPQVAASMVRPRIDERLCGAAEFASGLIANGLLGSMVICCGQAKQIPSADAFPRKQSPSSLSKSARKDEFPRA
jgi:hypothetical protein